MATSQWYSTKRWNTAILLEATSRGDRAAIGQVIQRFEPFFQATTRRFLGPQRFVDEGDDVLQALRLAAVKALPAVRARDLPSLAAWMKKLVQSRLLDWDKARRAQRRMPRSPVQSLAATDAPEVASLAPTPSGLLMQREELERLREAIGEVPWRYQPLLNLLCEKSPTLEEVARFLQKEPEAARKFVARALLHLRQALDTKRRSSSRIRF